MRSSIFTFMLLFSFLGYAVLASAQEESAKKGLTVKVKEKDVQVYKTFEGTVESTSVVEIKTDFDKWTDLTIKGLAAEGSQVKEGDTLLSFETESIDKSLADSKLGLATAELDASDAGLTMQQAKKMEELDAKIAQNKWEQAQQDHDYYFQTQKPQNMKTLDFRTKSSEYGVEYARDELEQLKMMYEEDELTEESEMIVLKRAERSLESAMRGAEMNKLSIDRQKNIDYPRQDIEQNNSLTMAQLQFEKFKLAAEIKKARVDVAMKKAELQLKEKRSSYKKLVADREKMSVSSPGAGILYHGRCVNGKWVGVNGTPNRRLEPGKKIPVNKVVMTIVDPTKVAVRASVDEDVMGLLKSGMKGKAMLNSNRETFGVETASVGHIPMDNGKFEVQLNVDGDVSMMPGLKCKVSMLVHQASNQLVAPAKSVFSDDGGISHHVYTVDGNKVNVQVGMTSGGDIEILRGLKAGDEIMTSKPE